MSNVSTLHTTGIIVTYTSKFAFVGSIPKAMLRDVPPANKVLEGYRIIPASGFHPLTPEMQSKDRSNKGCKKGEKKKGDNEGTSELVNTSKKQKAKTAPSTVAPKKWKLKRVAHKTKSPTPY